MSPLFQDLSEIKDGLSKKIIFRKLDKKLNKIIIDYSKEKKEFKNFLNSYALLRKINISIPKIYEVHSEKYLIVMEDFGENRFDKIYQEKKLYDFLKLAVDNLIIIQNSIQTDNLKTLEKYTYSHLNREISEFVDYYIPYKKISNFPINNFFETWKGVYDAHSLCFDSFVHKDFEFINLFFLKSNNFHLQCGIIDFQNAFIGFKGWDLFSLLENPRQNFTRKYNEDLIKYFYEKVIINIDFHTFRNQYYILNLSRQIRLLGRWVKLINEGNDEFLNYIDSTEERIRQCLMYINDEKLKIIYSKVFCK